MTDLDLDENFYVQFDETHDVGTVEGVEEFKQHISSLITDYFFEHIGDRNNSNIESKLNLQARRVAEESQYVSSYEGSKVDNQEGNTLSMTIFYNLGEEYEFEVV